MLSRGLHRLVEARIQDAKSRGTLEHLPGAGKPLPDDGLDNLPEEQRAEALLMRTVGAAEEVALLRELEELRERLAVEPREWERQNLLADLRAKAVRLSLRLEMEGKFLSARRVMEGIP